MYRLEDLARLVGGELVGDPELRISGVAPIDEASPTDISMAAEARYVNMIPSSRAGAFLVGTDVAELSRPAIRVANPRMAFIKLLEAFNPDVLPPPGIHPTAVIGKDVSLGADVSIQAYVTIEDGATIGDGVVLHAGVRIGRDVVIGDHSIVYHNAVIRSRSRIGRRAIIHANAVVGSDGYGFVTDDAGHHKVPHIGWVEIEDDVEIGAAVTVDRGTCGVTRIGRGTKIGNLTQIAHNVQIGEDCLIVGMAGIAGSGRIGNRVTIAGQVGMIDHITVGDGAVLGARSMITKDVPPGTFVSGAPARPHAEALRIQAGTAQLPRLLDEVKELRKRLAELEKKISNAGS